MKTKTIYMTHDGKEFRNEPSAVNHALTEAHLLLLEITKDACPYLTTAYKVSQDLILHLDKLLSDGDIDRKLSKIIKYLEDAQGVESED